MKTPPWLFGHGAARAIVGGIGAAAAGTLCRAVLAAAGMHVPYMAFFPWIAVAGLVMGSASGFLAVVLLTLLSAAWLEPTTLVPTRSPLVGLGIFASGALVVAGMTAWANHFRKKMRDASQVLRDSEARLRAALDAGNMGTWEWSIPTGKVIWSEALEVMHGRAPGAFKGTLDDVLATVHPDDRRRVIDSFQLAVTNRCSHDIEYRILGSNGDVRWLEGRGRVIGDANGRPSRMVGVCMDVTARKQAQETVARNERQMRLITNALPALIAYVDRNERYVFVSRAYETWLGQPCEAIRGKTVREILPPDLYEKIRPHVETALSGKVAHFRARTTYVDGLTRDVDATYSPDIGPDGQVNGFAGMVIDVSDLQSAQRELAHAQRHFQVLTETVPDFVWSTSPEGRIEYVNPQYVKFTGLTLERINGGGWHEVVHPDDCGSIERAWERSIREGAPFELEYRFRNQGDQQYRWFLSRTVPVRDDQGRIVRWVGAATDIHEAKVAREQRESLLAAERAAREEAERAGRVKDQFLAVLSHELRTPLTPVLLTVSLLEASADLPQHLREDVASIRRSVELEARLIDDLLDLTRVSRGKIQYDFQPVDIHLLIRSALTICCSDERLSVNTVFAAPRAFVHGDPARLQQVFCNLFNNAWKFTPPGGTVTIHTKNCDDRICIEVTDSGEGINAEALPRIFDAFEQGDAIRARKFGGLGLGLAICKALVVAHQGSIVAESAGQRLGTTMRVDLPLVPAPANVPIGPQRPPAGDPGLGKLRMLLVEDHPFTLKALQRLLKSVGHEVDGATCVAEGLRAAENAHYDLVISDLGLPDGTGHELMQQLRAMYGLRGIALTGYGMEEDVARSREAGFAEHLVKPVDLQKLQAAIARIAIGPG